MDNDYGDLMLVGLVIVVHFVVAIGLVLWLVRQKGKAQAAEQARRINRRTWSVSNAEKVSPELAAEIVRNEHVSYVLVEEFIRRTPDAIQKTEDGGIELDRARLIAWLVRSEKGGKPRENQRKIRGHGASRVP